MIFHEIYGCYYNTVAKILEQAVGKCLTKESMRQLIQENAFGESVLTILPALQKEEWQLLTPSLQTPLRHTPTMPLTVLQKRWMKAISLDERIQLFRVPTDFLEGVEPLFTPEDYVIFDRYLDGDPYQDEHYIHIFHTILDALPEKKKLRFSYIGGDGKEVWLQGVPYQMEYSAKDDKFRVLVKAYRKKWTLNIARIEKCKYGEGMSDPPVKKEPYTRYIRMELIDERNALERAMLHFAHFEKEAERVSDKEYRIRISYQQEDETELLIRVLAFGPFLRVTEPESFVNLIRERLLKQKSCGL